MVFHSLSHLKKPAFFFFIFMPHKLTFNRPCFLPRSLGSVVLEKLQCLLFLNLPHLRGIKNLCNSNIIRGGEKQIQTNSYGEFSFWTGCSAVSWVCFKIPEIQGKIVGRERGPDFLQLQPLCSLHSGMSPKILLKQEFWN